MGKGERSSGETQAHNISSRQEENRGGAACTLGEVQSGEEEVGVGQMSLSRVRVIAFATAASLLPSAYAAQRRFSRERPRKWAARTDPFPDPTDASQDLDRIIQSRRFVLGPGAFLKKHCKTLTYKKREMEERFREVSTEKVGSRLSSQLIRLSKQVGRSINGDVEISLSRPDLAQMTGTTLFTVSRLLCLWKSLGIVSVRREVVLVRNLEALEQLSQSE